MGRRRLRVQYARDRRPSICAPANSYAPRPSDYITKIAGVPCAAPGTPHPVWTAFLERIAPDPELRAFLQRFIGYCLTGATTEHKFVFAYGTGANGKSTFINTIAAILGDYATIADVGTFIASNYRAPSRPTSPSCTATASSSPRKPRKAAAGTRPRSRP